MNTPNKAKENKRRRLQAYSDLLKAIIAKKK